MVRYVEDRNVPADDTTRRAFSRFASAGDSTCVIVFAPSAAPSRDLVPTVVEALRESAYVKQLGLVHQSPLLGFLASSIVLQVPGVEVRAFRDLQAVQELWPGA
jgi:hypothetical protein